MSVPGFSFGLSASYDMLAVGSETQWRNGRLLKRNLQFAIGIVISAVFIYMALPGLHFQLVLETLQSANYWWLLPGVAVFFVGLWVRTWRWQYMLRPIKPVPILHLFPLVCIGYFGNNVFPFRAGEVLRSYRAETRGTDLLRLQPYHGADRAYL